MQISAKHNQITINRADFTGGLNSSTAKEMIADNELAMVENMEIDNITGLLRTVKGTSNLFVDNSKTFKSFAFDKINNVFLIIDNENKVYRFDRTLKQLTIIGVLTGKASIVSEIWEDGILIASGGKLQYYNGTSLLTIDQSPDVCMGVYVRGGRVFVFYDNTIKYSSIGDETNWSENNNDPSSSKFVEAGYKDGGNITGMVNMSSDVLIIKDNNRIYRLSGEYPDWVIKELARNISCKNKKSYCSTVNNVFILGETDLQMISTTQEYGDMKASNIAMKVKSEIVSLSSEVKLRYIPQLNQIWALSGNRRVLVFDCNFNAFFVRVFNSEVQDVTSVNDNVYILKNHSLSILNDDLVDDGIRLPWKFEGKTITSYNDLLLKRVRANITPYFTNRADISFIVGKVKIESNLPDSANNIYRDYSVLFSSKREIKLKLKNDIYNMGYYIAGNDDYLYQNKDLIKGYECLRTESRCVYRDKGIELKAKGSGGSFLLNSINYDIVEV